MFLREAALVNAQLVGAKTVRNTSAAKSFAKFVWMTAATRVVSSDRSNITSTTVRGGSFLGGGMRTESIMCTTPLPTSRSGATTSASSTKITPLPPMETFRMDPESVMSSSPSLRSALKA